jgi:hypothetical protein
MIEFNKAVRVTVTDSTACVCDHTVYTLSPAVYHSSFSYQRGSDGEAINLGVGLVEEE